MLMCMEFATTASVFNRRDPPVPRSLPLEDFVSLLTTFTHGSKETAQLWMPCVLRTASREAAAVEAITSFVVDCDTLTTPRLEAKIEDLTKRNVHFLVHSSASYAPPHKAKARFVFFPDAPIPVGTPYRWRDALWPRLADHLGFRLTADGACRNADRAYYLPVKPAIDAPTFTHYSPGEDLDTQRLLGAILALPVKLFDFHREYVNREDSTCIVSPQSITDRLCLKFFKKGKLWDAIELVLKGTPTQDGVGRHEVISRFTWALAHVVKEEEPSTAVLKVAEPWCEAMRQRYGVRGHESWYEEMLRMFRGARAKYPEWQARRASMLHSHSNLLKLFDSGALND